MLPARAAGPSLRQLVLGSEGAFGVITRVALRVRRLRETAYDAWTVGSFMEGAELLRRLEQGGIAPDIARLSDEEETRLSVALAGTGSLGRKLLDDRCLLICGWEGAVGRAAAARALVRGGARPLGGAPGRAWERSRFAGPHLRDDLMDRGVLVETLETATTWGNLEPLYDAVRGALDGVHVGCHVSHLYPTGASLYFTLLGAQTDDPAGAVGARSRPPRRARSSRRAARSPTTTRSAATTGPTWATRSASSGWSCCGRSRNAATPPGS